MKKLRLFATGLMALILGALVVTAVSAQTGITATPSQLAIAGTRGETEIRTLLLRATGPITGLHAIPLDLSRTDGDAVLPADAIRVTLPADQVAADTPLTLPVQVDLQDAPSGEFNGELLINYHGGALAVPVTVTVKDPLPLPLVIMVAGVALGMGVSAYRSRGRPRDEVLVRLGQVRTQIKTDAELREKAQPFYSRIEAELVDVEAALQARKWAEAQQAVEQAETVWVRWRKGRADWLMQLDYYRELADQLAQLGKSVFYVRTLDRSAYDAYRAIPDADGPNAFRTALTPLAEQINDFIALRAQIETLNQLGEQSQAQAFQQQLYDLTPGDKDTYQALKTQVEEAIDRAQMARLYSKAEAFEKMCAHLPDRSAVMEKARDFSQRAAALRPDDQDSLRALQDEMDAAMEQIAPAMQRPDRDGIPNMSFEIARSKSVDVTPDLLQERATEFERVSNDIPDRAAWLEKAREFSQRAKALQPGDQRGYQTLQRELDVAMEQVAPVTQRAAARGAESFAAKSPTPVAARLPGAPTARARAESPEEQAARAQGRLRVFTWSSYVIAVALLAGAGFSELYVANATFGANAWGDYFALLAWGFGTEATRAAVTDMVRNWGLPGLS